MQQLPKTGPTVVLQHTLPDSLPSADHRSCTEGISRHQRCGAFDGLHVKCKAVHKQRRKTLAQKTKKLCSSSSGQSLVLRPATPELEDSFDLPQVSEEDRRLLLRAIGDDLFHELTLPQATEGHLAANVRDVDENSPLSTRLDGLVDVPSWASASSSHDMHDVQNIGLVCDKICQCFEDELAEPMVDVKEQDTCGSSQVAGRLANNPGCCTWDEDVTAAFLLDQQLFATALAVSYQDKVYRISIHIGMSSTDIRAAIAAEVPRLGGNFRLREPVDRSICPLTADSLLHHKHPKLPFMLEEVTAAGEVQAPGDDASFFNGGSPPFVTASETGSTGQAPTSPQMAWVQEPPHSACEWLSLKAANASSMPHCFSPAPAVALPDGADLVTLDPASCLHVSLWTASFEDVSEHLHAGLPDLHFDPARKRVVACWHSMSISEIPANVIAGGSGGVADGGGVMAARVARAHTGGRGTYGWFHLQIEFRARLPGNPPVPPLVLREASGAPAKMLIKHQRCKSTGRWKERRVGPYADHSACAAAGSHIDACGHRLCKECG